MVKQIKVVKHMLVGNGNLMVERQQVIQMVQLPQQSKPTQHQVLALLLTQVMELEIQLLVMV